MKKKTAQEKKFYRKTANNRQVPKWLRNRVLERDNNQCISCGSSEELTMDHKDPVSKGGKTTLRNLQSMCYPCNQFKGNSPIEHIYEWRELLIERRHLQVTVFNRQQFTIQVGSTSTSEKNIRVNIRIKSNIIMNPIISYMTHLESELAKEFRSRSKSFRFLALEKELAHQYKLVNTVYGQNRSVFRVSA
jgi:hypothetical protein